MKNKIACTLILLFYSLPSWVFAVEVRLKDIAKIESAKLDQVTGFGLVVGLSNTGDTKSLVASETLKNYLNTMGVSTKQRGGETRNVASALLIVYVPSYAKIGDRLDVWVSSIGDARSLEGGVLLQSPLRAGNGKVIAVASGVLTFGGKDPRTNDKRGGKNTALIPGGAIVENEIPSDFLPDGKIKIQLMQQDFATLNAVKEAIQTELGSEPQVLSPIELLVDASSIPNKTELLSKLENLSVTAENSAKIVINERTGTIVMSSNIAVDEVAISKQGLSLSTNKPQDRRYFLKSKDTNENDTFLLKETTKVSDIVDALNKVGASTKDIISILEALKASGALKAELIIQ